MGISQSGAAPLLVSPLDSIYTAGLVEQADEAGRAFLHQLDVTGGGLCGSPSIRRPFVRGKRLCADGAIPPG